MTDFPWTIYLLDSTLSLARVNYMYMIYVVVLPVPQPILKGFHRMWQGIVLGSLTIGLSNNVNFHYKVDLDFVIPPSIDIWSSWFVCFGVWAVIESWRVVRNLSGLVKFMAASPAWLVGISFNVESQLHTLLVLFLAPTIGAWFIFKYFF